MIKIAILGNYATQFFNKSLKKTFKFAEYQISTFETDYNTIDFEIINKDSDLYAFVPDFIIMHESDLGFKNEFYERGNDDKVSFYEQKIEILTNRLQILSSLLPNCKIIYPSLFLKNDNVFGNYYSKSKSTWFYQINKYNAEILDVAIQFNNFLVLDSFSNLPNDLIVRNPFLINSSDLHYTIDYLDWLSMSIKKSIDSFKGKFIKCVVLDLDNTLWGGIIGDDGLLGIKIGENGIGKAFTNLQKWIKQLKYRGIILAVCSKNEESIAKQPFEEHSDMILRLSDIAIFVANWNSKADNINQIREILNIGFDSMVFLDDNPAEREIVKKHIPEIVVPDLPVDVSEYLPYLISLNLFETTSISKNDEKRTIQYQEEAKRLQFANSITNMDDFLTSLNMKAKIQSFVELDYERLAQLSQRSNQYNLRTIRYSFQDIKQIAESNEYVTFSISLKDKFGDYGLISMVIVKMISNDEAFIETWIMSCRVLKRTVEHLVMNTIIEKMIEKKISLIKGEYLETKKNILVQDLLSGFGFKNDGNIMHKYILNVSEFNNQKTSIEYEN
jgi:FkbH-like protein